MSWTLSSYFSRTTNRTAVSHAETLNHCPSNQDDGVDRHCWRLSLSSSSILFKFFETTILRDLKLSHAKKLVRPTVLLLDKAVM